METSLFATSATLLSGKMSQKRINDDSMQTFVKVLKLESENEKLNALNESNIRENFSAFPPLWYELGNAYQNTGNSSSALRCYRQFEQLKKYDALKKDKNYINVLKNKIQIYLGPDKANVLANAKRHKEEILDCIALIKANYLDSESGEMNSYLARIYYLIGETSESLKCLDYLISSKTLHPEYIEEAIALRSLIRSASQTEYSEIYRVAFNFGKVMYGNDNAEVQQIVKKTTGFWNSIKTG